MKKFVITLLLLTIPANADRLYTFLGHGSLGHIGGLGYSRFVTPYTIVRGNFGGYTHANLLWESPKVFGEAAFGVRIQNTMFYAEATQGFLLLSEKGKGLASYYQLPTTVSAGIISPGYAASLGVFWKHLSNGTVSGKNSGREYLGIEYSQKF